VFVVAILELSSPVEQEAPLLAAELGINAYEARQLLSGGTPILVLRTKESARARDFLRTLRGRGHGTVACDDEAVVSGDAMVPVRFFHFDPDELVLEGQYPLNLRYEHIRCLVAATHRRTTESLTESKERKLRPGLAIATGGLVSSKLITRQISTTEEEREQVLYVFHDGAPPVLLRETAAKYGALGPDLAPSTHENFKKTVERIRGSAPRAIYDDRLTRIRRVASAVRSLGPGAETSSQAGMDVLAHLVALYYVRHVAPAPAAK
jgi:hypothetical protein